MKIRNLRYWILTADLLWVLGASGLAMALRYAGTRDAIDFTTRFQTYSFMIIAAVVAWILLYFEMSLDGFKGVTAAPSKPYGPDRHHSLEGKDMFAATWKGGELVKAQ